MVARRAHNPKVRGSNPLPATKYKGHSILNGFSFVQEDSMETIKVTEANYFRRLDKFLKNEFKDMSMGAIFSFIRKGKVKVNNKKAKQNNFVLDIGDEVTVYQYTKEIEKYKKDKKYVDMNLEIIYEDQYILVINKPVGIPVHASNNKNEATIEDGLNFIARDQDFNIFITHRLDKYTSGVLIVAKTRSIARKLSITMKKKDVEYIRKFYLALGMHTSKFNGKKSGTITAPIEERRSTTKYNIIETSKISGKDVSLIDIELFSGRKHQIRIHLSSIGLPVVGDNKHGHSGWDDPLKVLSERFKGYFLHCNKMYVRHPVYNSVMLFKAPLPAERESTLNSYFKKLVDTDE